MKLIPGLRGKSTLTAGQHAVITGGSSGLGLDVALRLAERGIRTTLVARDRDKLDKAQAAIRAAVPSTDVRVVAADVSDGAGLEKAFAELVAETGAIDILINSAGILREGYFEKLAAADFRDIMDINFFGTLNAVRAALPHLKASKGRIVNIASVAGLTGAFGYTAYCASKHALVGFTEALRYELEPQGVRVHLVCPAEFDSPMVDALDRTRTPENREHTLTIPKLPVGQIAAELIDGVNADHARIVPGRLTRVIVGAQRLAPTVVGAVARRRIARVYRGPGSSTATTRAVD